MASFGWSLFLVLRVFYGPSPSYFPSVCLVVPFNLPRHSPPRPQGPDAHPHHDVTLEPSGTPRRQGSSHTGTDAHNALTPAWHRLLSFRLGLSRLTHPRHARSACAPSHIIIT
ncbi:hypothetical protein B0H14DRAFT_2867100 [Mycena olivaceomarginata]|nr:hypothetical protein B0H14DRAFT_2867100 [Mycena olivaceomarginata]